jgi:hypothetical protein
VGGISVERTTLVILILFATVSAAILVAWTAGVLDLGGDGDERVLTSHEWRTAGTSAEPEVHDVNLTFEVGSGVDRLRISYELDLPSGLVLGLPDTQEDLSPEVRLELMDGGGQVIWADVFYASVSSDEVVGTDGGGEWTLHVWARCYGYEGQTGIGTTVEFHDSLKVTVTVP